MSRASEVAWRAGVVATATAAAYLAWRPRMLRWGATEQEATEALPGDEQTPQPRVQSTRAITIEAPPARVWPWLVQMGIGRGGFYTHDWLERLLTGSQYAEGRHSATRIHPELQQLRVGDLISLGGGVHTPVVEIEPERHLVTFETFVLRPLPGARTRLIVRTRGAGYLEPAVEALDPDARGVPGLIGSVVRHVPGRRAAARGFDLLIGDPLHHYMDKGMLEGIKRRAEAAA